MRNYLSKGKEQKRALEGSWQAAYRTGVQSNTVHCASDSITES